MNIINGFCAILMVLGIFSLIAYGIWEDYNSSNTRKVIGEMIIGDGNKITLLCIDGYKYVQQKDGKIIQSYKSNYGFFSDESLPVRCK